MSRIFDSSAILAYLLDEPGAKQVEEALIDSSYTSLLNWAEVLSYYARRGLKPRALEAEFLNNGLILGLIEVIPPENTDAIITAELHFHYPELGLSLADRFCLALGQRLKLPIFTADRSWMKLPAKFQIRTIR